MKKNSTSLFTSISTENLDNLTTVVKETLANGYNQPNGKVFTTADLWNIQRQGRTWIQRRFAF